MVGIIDKMHPYTVFKQQGFHEKSCREMLLVYYPYHSYFCFLILPSLLSHEIFLYLFMALFIC